MQLTQPNIIPIQESGDIYELAAPFIFTLRTTKFFVPMGFKFDGASYAKLLFQRDGMHRAAALVHDYLYANKGTLHGYFKYTRKEADNLFRDMLISYGVKSWHVALSYRAVRLFGGLWWKD